MPGQKIPVILNANLTLDGRSRKVTNLGEDGTEESHQTAEQQHIYPCNGVETVNPKTIKQAKHQCRNDTTDRAFNGFFRA